MAMVVLPVAWDLETPLHPYLLADHHLLLLAGHLAVQGSNFLMDMASLDVLTESHHLQTQSHHCLLYLIHLSLL